MRQPSEEDQCLSDFSVCLSFDTQIPTQQLRVGAQILCLTSSWELLVPRLTCSGEVPGEKVLSDLWLVLILQVDIQPLLAQVLSSSRKGTSGLYFMEKSPLASSKAWSDHGPQTHCSRRLESSRSSPRGLCPRRLRTIPIRTGSQNDSLPAVVTSVSSSEARKEIVSLSHSPGKPEPVRTLAPPCPPRP